jgi:hypothetical protein
LTRSGCISHIYSKIGLSRVLSSAGLKTPAFLVASTCEDAVSAARQLGYPVLIKTDSASGGTGIYTCKGDQDIWKLRPLFTGQPLLIQQRIEGRELDLSAIYFDRKLVHFTYSLIERTTPKTTALSAIRTYHPLAIIPEDVFEELAALGRALDASGFASISCIDAADGSGRYYFEADMRPNVWVDVSRFYGEDAALRIRDWFVSGKTLSRPAIEPDTNLAAITIPHFMRIARWELITNRHNVWRFIPWSDTSVVLRQLCSRTFMPVARSVVPQKLRQVVKRGMIGAGIAFP